MLPNKGVIIKDITFTFDEKNLVLGGAKTCYFNIETKKVEKRLTGHSEDTIWVSRSPCNNFILTTSEMETIIWNVKTMEIEIVIEEKIIIVFSKNKTVAGFLHDGMFKGWTDDFLESFSDEYKIKKMKNQKD